MTTKVLKNSQVDAVEIIIFDLATSLIKKDSFKN
jgi:hypothetical protein